jgi:hypothetical protein
LLINNQSRKYFLNLSTKCLSVFENSLKLHLELTIKHKSKFSYWRNTIHKIRINEPYDMFLFNYILSFYHDCIIIRMMIIKNNNLFYIFVCQHDLKYEKDNLRANIYMKNDYYANVFFDTEKRNKKLASEHKSFPLFTYSQVFLLEENY